MDGRYKLAIHISMRVFSLVSGLLPVALQGALLIILIHRKLYRIFPFFLTCTIYSIPVTVARLYAMGSPRLFFVLVWTTEMIYGVLALLAIREVFEIVLERHYVFRLWMRWLPIAGLLAVFANAIWQALYRPMGYKLMAHFAAGAYAFVPGVLGLQALIFVFCIWLAFRKRGFIRWSRYEAGILVGFGLSSAATLLIYLARFQLGNGLESLFRFGPSAAYFGATVIWLLAFYLEERWPKRTARDAEIYRRAAEFMSKAADEAEEDLGLRFAHGN